MEKEYVLSDEALEKILDSVSAQRYWVVCNLVNYFLIPEDFDFFRTREEAICFVREKQEDSAGFSLIYVESVRDLLVRLPYGKAPVV